MEALKKIVKAKFFFMKYRKWYMEGSAVSEKDMFAIFTGSGKKNGNEEKIEMCLH